MKNVYIDAGESRWLEERFGNGIVALELILDACEDLIIENKEIKEELEDLKQDLHDNYTPISSEEQYE